MPNTSIDVSQSYSKDPEINTYTTATIFPNTYTNVSQSYSQVPEINTYTTTSILPNTSINVSQTYSQVPEINTYTTTTTTTIPNTSINTSLNLSQVPEIYPVYSVVPSINDNFDQNNNNFSNENNITPVSVVPNFISLAPRIIRDANDNDNYTYNTLPNNSNNISVVPFVYTK